MGIILVCLYGLLILWLALRTAVPGDASAFFVNRRQSGPLGVCCSIVVSCVGASATLGMIGLAFQVGTPAFWWLGCGALGLALLSGLMAARVRQTGAFTMPELVTSILGPFSRPAISIIILLAWTAILAAQLTAATLVLSGMTGFSDRMCLAMALALIALHTTGGQAAIMRIDLFQAGILAGSLLLVLVWLTGQNPGWAANVTLEAVNRDFPPSRLAYFLLVVGANYLVCPMLFGRLLSARDSRSASRGGFLAALALAACAAVICAIGLACVGLLPAGTPADLVLSRAMLENMPDWLYLAVSLGLLSAIVSSADSCLVTAASVGSNDLLRRSTAYHSRACVFLVAGAGAGLSLWGKDILSYLLMAYDVYACGVVVPVCVGLLFSGKKRRLLPEISLAGIICGGGLGLIAGVTGDTAYSYAGMAVSGLVTLAGVRRRKSGTEVISWCTTSPQVR